MKEGDELFDPNALEETVKKLISSGKRNFSIDLSDVDYLYSDSINKFIQLNHEVLNVYGRLALLSPSEEVSKILKRAGIENFLRIYGDINELRRASDEIIQQTAAVSTAAVKEFTPEPEPKVEKPVSEFEDLRAEIGKALETPAQDEIESVAAPAPPPPPSPPPPPPPPPQPPPPPPTPKVEKPEVPEIPTFEVSNKKAEVSPKKPLPDFGGPEVAPPKEKEPAGRDFKPYVTEKKPSVPPEERFAEITEEDRFADDRFEKKKKKAPVLVVLLLLCICAIGVVAFFAINNASKKKITKAPPKIEEKVPEVVPQIEEKVEDPEVVTEEKPEIEKPKEVVKKIPPKKAAPKRPKKRYISKPTPTPKKATPKKVASKTVTKPATVKRIVVTSYPTSATVRFNGKVLGKTPYTWTNPSVYGNVTLSAEKSGYESKDIDFEFTGGIVKKHFVLSKKTTPVVTPTPRPKPKPTPIAKPTPKPVIETTPLPEPEPVKPVERPVATSGGSPGTIFISSLPPMADVYMDGTKIGKTNIDKLKIKSGTHVMKFVKGAKELTKQMTFTSGENPSQLVRLK